MTTREAGGGRTRALVQLLRTAETIWNASRGFFARWELSPSQFNVVNLLAGEPDGLTQSELSRQLLMHRSNATGLVDRLERRGLLERRSVPGDRRAHRVLLTPVGRRLVEEILPHYHRAAETALSGLTEAGAARLRSELEEVCRRTERAALQARREGRAP